MNKRHAIKLHTMKFLAISSFIAHMSNSYAHTVYIYLTNKTHDTIYAATPESIVPVYPGKQEVIGCQERTPTQRDDCHPKPGLITNDIPVYCFKLNDPLTITVTTSSTDLSSLTDHSLGEQIVKRDKLEWTISHPSDKEPKKVADTASLSRYTMDKNQAHGVHKSYLIRGEKEGSDLPVLPAADLLFSIEEIQ